MNEYKFYLTLIVLFGSLLIIIFTGAFGYMTDILEGVGMGARNIYTIYNSEHIENCVGCKEVEGGSSHSRYRYIRHQRRQRGFQCVDWRSYGILSYGYNG